MLEEHTLHATAKAWFPETRAALWRWRHDGHDVEHRSVLREGPSSTGRLFRCGYVCLDCVKVFLC